MKLEAKSRLVATEANGGAVILTAAPLTPKSVDIFLQSVGLSQENGIGFGKPTLSKSKRYWEMGLEDGDMDDIENALRKSIGKPVVSPEDSEYAFSVWNVKGKGVVAFNSEESQLLICNGYGATAIWLILDMFGDDARSKGYDVDEAKKHIQYQPYENSGRRLSKRLIRKLLKGFGLSDWTFEVERGHWG